MTITRDDKLFRSKVPWIVTGLMNEFMTITAEDACAILGNLGHECAGFHLFQEQKPLVPGSRGGFGWAQWTGPRRKAFEAFVADNDLDPKGDRANFEFLVKELKTTEAAAMPALKKAIGLNNKVIAFEKKFERAAEKYKHYERRLIWAERAADEFAKVGRKPLPWLKVTVVPPPPPLPPPQVPDLPDYAPPPAEQSSKAGTIDAAIFAVIAILSGGVAYVWEHLKEGLAWLLQ